MCQIIHFCTSFTYGRSDLIIYERNKKLSVWRATAKKLWVFFLGASSNPSKLQQNLISRRVVSINGLMYMASKDWKISTFLHHRCILSLLQYGNSIIALHFIVMVNHCALPGKHLRKIRKMYFPNWFQNWFLKTYLKPFRKKGFRGHD